MVVVIYGHSWSTNIQRITVVCKEVGIDYNVVPVDYANNEHKSSEWTQNFHPFGQSPVMVDEDGFKLFESRAIARYLAEKYGKGKLIPTDTKKRALFEQAASIENNQFDSSASGIAREKIFKPAFGRQTDEAKLAEHAKALEEKLKGYEIILSKQKYLAGDELTLADIFHLPVGAHLEGAGLNLLQAVPNVKRWWGEISSLPSWKAVIEESSFEGRVL